MSDNPTSKRPPPGSPPGSEAVGTPARDLGIAAEGGYGYGMLGSDGSGRGYLSPGARKEKRRQRNYERGVRRVRSKRPYVELRSCSSFSFLRGSSEPEDLIAAAAERGLEAAALLDRNGVYGAPRFYKAARQAGVRALVGAEVVVEGPPFAPAFSARHLEKNPDSEVRLSLLVRNQVGYKNLCRLLSAGALGRPKGEARVSLVDLERHGEGLHCLTGAPGGTVAATLAGSSGPGNSHVLAFERARRVLERLHAIYDGRLHVELQRHGLRAEEHRNRALEGLARALRLPIVATNGVRYATLDDKPLHDVMTCIRHHTTLDAAGAILAPERQRAFCDPLIMNRRFADLPHALDASYELAAELDFTLADLGYRFPDYPLPPGETPASYLRHLTWNGARARFRPLTAKAQRQIEKELAMIEKLELAGYFLIVHDLVMFCKRRGILAQGRGSAANSAVCYALSITAVDPVKMGLLFERFLSEERGEWPDIDLDLPSGDQRESVIQYVYQRYGPKEGGGYGAAMTANVITYRDRMAAREVSKALGYSAEQVDALSKKLGSWHYDIRRGDQKALAEEFTTLGFDPEEPRLQLFARMWLEIQNHPRHLGQHSGGMVIAAGRLDEIVPLEPAAMEDRVVVQWDKDDCADLGLIKVDLLGLGMLCALEEAVPLVRLHEKVNLDLAHLPPDDPKTYAMLQKADTVGVFQVESRAQMASLPRNKPERFYDLVIQVAIIRPGPIVGKMAHPYFERRMGREKVTYPDPSLEPVLERTLGVPIFQEQILRMAMVAAGFSGGEAEELRRAMGFKRSMEKMDEIEKRLRSGMQERGIHGEAQDRIVQSITAFALYGFPESHAASFALIAYASAYLKCHHPTAFFMSLLNAWPMGFYHPASLVKEAQRAGSAVLPIDVVRSGWRCRWEKEPEKAKRAGAIRLGLRYVQGLRQEAGEAIETEQTKRPFRNVEDLVDRAELRAEEARSLARLGALASLASSTNDQPGAAGKLTRRQALWQVARATRPQGPMFQGLEDRAASPLREMTQFEETLADFEVSSITTGKHPITYYREDLTRLEVRRASELDDVPAGQSVRIAGSVIVRQRPGTAKGLLFLTLEDETGMIQAIVMPDLLREYRNMIVRSAGLIVEGVMQRLDGSTSVKADRLWPLSRLTAIPSHDFH